MNFVLNIIFLRLVVLKIIESKSFCYVYVSNLCNPVDSYHHFGEICSLYLQERRIWKWRSGSLWIIDTFVTRLHGVTSLKYYVIHLCPADALTVVRTIYFIMSCDLLCLQTHCLEELQACNVALNEQFMPILSRALRIGTQLQVLKLENCDLSGRPIVILGELSYTHCHWFIWFCCLHFCLMPLTVCIW